MKKLLTGVLVLAMICVLTSCKKDMPEEGGAALQTYRLPTEWTVTHGDGKTTSFTVAYDGGTATVTKDGAVALRVTLDGAGNVVHRENADGSRLEATYDADGYLTETLLRDADGEAKQRTVYDRNGHKVKEYTRGRFDEVTLRVFTYGEIGELLTETQYGSYGYHTYEYHPNGVRAAETTYLLDLLPHYREEFDENGNRTWEYSYDEEGNVSYRCEYDAEGNTVAEYDADGNPYVNERYEYTYDENGNQIEYRIYHDDGTLYELYKSEYDENGNEIAWRLYHEGDTLTREVFFTYDEAGILTKSVMKDYRASGELIDTTETEYDEAGNQIRYTAYDGEGNLSSRTEMEHAFIGGKWVLTRYTAYNGEESLWFWEEISHDERGNNTAELTYNADGTLSARIENTYDERDNQLESARYDGDGNVIERTVCTYDGENNLLEQTRYEGEEITSHTVCENNYTYDGEGRLSGESRASVEQRYTYTYKDSSGLRTETCTDGDGNGVHIYETVYDGNGNPKIEHQTELRIDWSYEKRYEYAWGEDGGLLSRIEYGEDKEEVFRMETGGHTDCTLTEAQYRQLLSLLYGFANRIFVEPILPTVWEE